MAGLTTVQGNAMQAASSADLFQRFIEYTDRQPATMKGYITCLRQFAAWITATGKTQPTRADILEYKVYLDGETFGRSGTEPLKTGTKQQYLRAVKRFFNENLNPPAMLGRAEKIVMGVRI